MELLDVRLIGVNAETGRKLLLTVFFLLAILGMRAAIVGVAHLVTERHRYERVLFWTPQGAMRSAAS